MFDAASNPFLLNEICFNQSSHIFAVGFGVNHVHALLSQQETLRSKRDNMCSSILHYIRT